MSAPVFVCPDVADAVVGSVVGAGQRVLVLHEAAAVPLAGLAWDVPDQPVWFIVGPEGGISEPEVDSLTAAGAEAVLLGPHVLRESPAGPAGIAALATLRGTWSSAPTRNTLGP